MTRVDERLPSAHRLSSLLDVLADSTTKVADERAELGAYLGAPEQVTELIVGALEQVGTDIGHEVLVADEVGHGPLQLGGQILKSRDHRLSHVPHGRAWSTEATHGLPKCGEGKVRSLRGDLPGSQHPLAPARHHHQQRAAPGLIGGVDVKWPAAIRFERGLQQPGSGSMEPGEVAGEASRQNAHFTGRDRNAGLEQICLDLLALTVVQEALFADEDHHVIADDAVGHQRFRYAGSSQGDQGTRRPATTCRADVNGLHGPEGPVLQCRALSRGGLLDLHRTTTT